MMLPHQITQFFRQLLNRFDRKSDRKAQAAKDNYPLRGLPLEMNDDFDESMPELWDSLRH